MKRIDSLCRNYLWCGKDTYMHAPAIGWDHCCSPKSEGGLGIKHAQHWNRALLGKYTWWVASKKDHLWVKWVSHVYLKGTHWTNYNPPSDCSWSWKKIVHTMQLFKNAYIEDLWLGSDATYTIKAGYDWLRDPKSEVRWWKTCWNLMNIPKASFIYWVYIHSRLYTRDRMARMGGPTDMACYLCANADESHDHLFFDCTFSSRCWILMRTKLQITLNPRELCQWNARGRRHSILCRRIVCACVIQLVYVIWQERNRARVHARVTQPEFLIEQAIKEVCMRFKARNKRVLSRRDEAWFQQIS